MAEDGRHVVGGADSSATFHERPPPIPPALAGQRQLGGWLDARGRFYPAGFGAHIRVAFLLRESGDGPADPWDIAKTTWAMVKPHGEVIALPGRLTQPQWDSLGDMLLNAPDGAYRSHLLAGLRRIQQFEMCAR